MVQVVVNRTQTDFNGTCAPFVYIEGCAPVARMAYVNVSRFWLPANSIVLIGLIAAFVYRAVRVREGFNTLRLAMVLFSLGLPLHIAFDALRVNGPHQHGVPNELMSFLWTFGFVPSVAALALMIVTWVSFASKDLLARMALTGHPVLYWSLVGPYVIVSLVLSVISGRNYWWYFVALRVLLCTWSAFLILLGLFGFYHGYGTLSKLKLGGDTFNYRQQLRVLIMIVTCLVSSGIAAGFQAYFLERIDQIYQLFLFFSTTYRVVTFSFALGSSLYVCYATIHHVKVSSNSLKRGTSSFTSARTKASSSTKGSTLSSSSNSDDDNHSEEADQNHINSETSPPPTLDQENDESQLTTSSQPPKRANHGKRVSLPPLDKTLEGSDNNV